VIDVAQQRFLILEGQGNLPFDEAEFAAAAPDRFRYYEFVGEELRLTVTDASGATSARLTWRRQ
jgi:hypothetical protein